MPLFCLILIIIHAIFPEFAIDNITIALIIIILFPWLIPYLSKAKFPGGFEFDFREESQRLEEISERSPQISDIMAHLREDMPSEMATRQDLFRFDPNLALASLRIDIEKRVKEIASQRDIPIYRKSLGAILTKLSNNDIIGSSEYDTLLSVISICNKAVHAEKIDHSAASKILEIGELALYYLYSIQ